ncbi:polysaccharide biosynthesis C-terminal domain-containing protein [Anabaena sp. FACHB-1237]|uniref:murein biosynthesis integral membrane protein MurJ n=1 Tax=Anabaena sp. FACHB-1237 TaxID=2692769 RepID=UPI0016801B32|nr:lipid II flippase MurJ [Anabaena sp. FACHB-1237]MBD2138461.1 polysaccharide biosynthesis C-terminal domain-containing protein [Anabaena sp. FACHB-1237]
MKNWQSKTLFNYWKKLTSGSINRQIFGASVTVAFMTALVKIVSVLKELVIAWRFGIEDKLDAFLIAWLVPDIILNVIAYSFNSALIPTYIKVREQDGMKAAKKLFHGASILSFFILMITITILIITAPIYLPIIASGFSHDKLHLTFSLLRVIAPIILISGIVSTWSAVLNAEESFALAAIVPIIGNIIGIFLLFFFKDWGIYSLVAGFLVSPLIDMFFIAIALKRRNISVLPKWYGFDDHLKQVVSQYAPMIIAAFIICSAGLVDKSMAAMLSPGSVSSLNYANRLIASPISLISIALSTAVVPYFSKMIANENWLELRRTFEQYTKAIVITTLPITIFFLFSSQLIVKIFFERGSFTAQDTNDVAQIQALYALQIPFYIINILSIRLITAMKSNQILIYFFGSNLIINIGLNYLFIQWIGIKGIALSTSCMYLFSSLAMLSMARRKIHQQICAEN